ncbi:ATP-binding protein [Cytophagales bacterium LB-30]|uniref:ATP-binding protein n=1 Tax=Shiella aurantiaca TaxID=3058365 RepID=A0ABT8F5L2_9BACT|nr:ATP-binding protein [Shiella aurantiaca]MDN4165588.1 ATP-binding protein [Shiella aurantiaca]
MNSIKLQIPSLVENIRIVESFIDNAKDKYEWDDDIYGNIMIAVTEAVNNAIKHGNRSDKSKMVHLQLDLAENKIQFQVEDEGKGFNYVSLPDPTAPENLEKPGGRGIFLMKHLCDEVSFSKEGRAVSLTFYFN